jgi:dTDP-4-amino-4,6-dideoxygalactose transaminase
VQTRRKYAAFINKALAEIDCVRVVTPPANVWHSCYKHYVFVRPERLAVGWDRDRILREFADAGIPALSGACPEIYLEKAFADSTAKSVRRLPAARTLGETSLQFLVHPTLTQEQVEEVVAVASRILTRAQRN